MEQEVTANMLETERGFFFLRSESFTKNKDLEAGGRPLNTDVYPSVATAAELIHI